MDDLYGRLCYARDKMGPENMKLVAMEARRTRDRELYYTKLAAEKRLRTAAEKKAKDLALRLRVEREVRQEEDRKRADLRKKEDLIRRAIYKRSYSQD